MGYKKIDIKNWDRKNIFEHFSSRYPSVMNLTVDIDITRLNEYSKQMGIKFYPAMMWVVSKVINAHDEFKYSYAENGDLILWDTVSPFYSDFHQDTQNFVKLVNEFTPDIFLFCENFNKIKESSQNLTGFDLENIPKNVFEVSCLPWVRYSSFNIHFYGGQTNLAPIVTWGKFGKKQDRSIMPLTLIVNHATVDGFHMSRFFNEVQEIINAL